MPAEQDRSLRAEDRSKDLLRGGGWTKGKEEFVIAVGLLNRKTVKRYRMPAIHGILAKIP